MLIVFPAASWLRNERPEEGRKKEAWTCESKEDAYLGEEIGTNTVLLNAVIGKGGVVEAKAVLTARLSWKKICQLLLLSIALYSALCIGLSDQTSTYFQGTNTEKSSRSPVYRPGYDQFHQM